MTLNDSKNRHTDQWNRAQKYIYDYMVNYYLTKEARVHNGAKILFNKWYWKYWTGICKQIKIHDQLTQHTRINSKGIKDLNVRCKTIKILEENTGSKISDISYGNIFANMCPRARGNKGKNKQMGIHQTEKLLHSKRNHQQNKKGIHCIGEYICQRLISKGINFQNI